jgi:hypothetical protein
MRTIAGLISERKRGFAVFNDEWQTRPRSQRAVPSMLMVLQVPRSTEDLQRVTSLLNGAAAE